MAMLCLFHRSSMCRPGHCAFMRSELLDLTTIIAATACHQSNYVEPYSRYRKEATMIYEVRTYTLRPGTVAEFEERYAKRLPLREQHSKLGAFWHTEFEPLNQVLHVYPYDDLAQRTAVRESLAQD